MVRGFRGTNAHISQQAGCTHDDARTDSLIRLPDILFSLLPSVWFGVAPGNGGHQPANRHNTGQIKLHGNTWETKRDVFDLSAFTPAA